MIESPSLYAQNFNRLMLYTTPGIELEAIPKPYLRLFGRCGSVNVRFLLLSLAAEDNETAIAYYQSIHPSTRSSTMHETDKLLKATWNVWVD
jgi:hypothetical protein